MRPLLAPVLLAALTALAACAGSEKPPETPESADGEKKAAPKDDPAADKTPPEGGADQGSDAPASPGAPPKPAVDKSMSLDTYELTPADCESLGKQYGEVARSDQMAALSPKLSAKQRDATAAQVDKVVSGLEDKWIAGCQASLVNKAVDHDALKCALSAKTVKAFDVCLNGEAGTPQPAGRPGKKK
jgi:hypothetical protein